MPGVHSFHLLRPGTEGNKPVRNSELLDRHDVKSLRFVYRRLRDAGIDRSAARSLILDVFLAGRIAGYIAGLTQRDAA